MLTLFVLIPALQACLTYNFRDSPTFKEGGIVRLSRAWRCKCETSISWSVSLHKSIGFVYPEKDRPAEFLDGLDTLLYGMREYIETVIRCKDISAAIAKLGVNFLRLHSTRFVSISFDSLRQLSLSSFSCGLFYTFIL